jgi:hypothetical protein
LFQVKSPGAGCFSSSCTGPPPSFTTTCTLSPGPPYTCSVTVWGALPGGVKITAIYPGDANNGASSGSAALTVT